MTNVTQQHPSTNALVAAPLNSTNGHHPLLLPQHRQKLANSALSDTIVAQRGYRSVTTPGELLELGFSRQQAAHVPGLLIPIYDVHGALAYHLYRPDNPRLNERGKPIKYETPAGTRLVVDVPPFTRPHLGNPAVTLFMVEGPIKADAVCSQGYAAIDVNGVYGWRGTNEHGGKVVLPDFESIALNDGRDVRLMYDSDAAQKSEVQTARRRLKRFGELKGAVVKIVNLQPGPNGEKTGPDDFFARGGTMEQLTPLTTDDLPGDSKRPRYVTLSDVEPQQMEWLREGHLARGMLTLLVGDGGLGKSLYIYDTAARMSKALAWPEKGHAPLGDSILLSAEDHLNVMLQPRVAAHGADLDRIHVLRGVGDDEHPFTLAHDLPALEQLIVEKKAVFVGIDPINNYIGGAVDSYKDTAVRAVLTPLIMLAERHNVAIVATMHVTKSTERRAIHKHVGSVAYRNLARVELFAVEDPESGKRYIAPTMKNTKVTRAVEYKVIEHSKDVPKLEWLGAVSEKLNLDAMLNATAKKPEAQEEKDSLRVKLDVEAFLNDMLKDGEVVVTAIERGAEVAGYGWRTVTRAKDRMGIQSRKEGQPGSDKQKWFWSLPPKPPKPDFYRPEEGQIPSGGGQTSTVSEEVTSFEQVVTKKDETAQTSPKKDTSPDTKKNDLLRRMLNSDKLGPNAKANLEEYLNRPKRTPVIR